MISLIRNEINERYNSRAATPDAYLNHMLRFNCSQDQIQTVIACLKESGIIKNGEVLVANIPQDLDNHMGLPANLHKQSKLIKTKLLEYAKAITSDWQKAWSQDFTNSLRDSLSSSAQKVITGAFDSEFANPIFELCSREFLKDFRQKTSGLFEDVFSGKYKEKAEAAKLAKDYQNAVKKSQEAQNKSLSHTAEEPKINKSSRPKSKDQSNDTPFNTQSALNSGYLILPNDKKYYDLGDLKTLDDYLDDPFASPKPIFSVTKPDQKVYTLVPYANAAASPNLTYMDLSLVWETGLGYAAKKYGPQVGKFLARKAVPFLAKGVSFTGKILLAKEVVEFAWNGTNELAKHLCPYDPELESFIYESTKHLSVAYIKGKENTVRASLAATREIGSDTCYMMRDWSFLQKFQYFVDKSEFWGNIYLNPRSLPWLDGTAQHRILHYQIEEYNVRCKDTSIRSEIVVLNGRIHLNGRPPSTKGASIVDGITSKESKQGYWEVGDAKFGILGITDEKAEKLWINMQGKQFKLYDVRASNSIHGRTKEFDLTSLKIQK